MTRLLHASLFAVLTASLLACGPPRKSVFAPSVSIQKVQVLANGQWQVTVRIQNNSYGEMDFRAINGQLQIAEGLPARLHATFERGIPALVGDVITLDILPSAAMTQALKTLAGQGSGGAVAYRISGRASATPEQEQQLRDFDFSGSDWLSPVPGVPNTYR